MFCFISVVNSEYAKSLSYSDCNIVSDIRLSQYQ